MSIQTQITRIENAKSDIMAAIEEQGVSVPEGASLDDASELIMQINSSEDIDYTQIEFDTEEIVVESDADSSSSLELLWENSNLTSSFGVQTITIENMSKYKFILFELRCYTNIVQRFTAIAANNGIETILSLNSTYASQGGGVTYRRDVCCNGDSITFGNGYRQLGTSETQDDGYAIPVCIYGIK